MNQRSLLKLCPVTLFLLLAGSSARAQAYLTQSINTYALNTASYNDLSGKLGPFPFSNFGVQATDNLGLMVSASVNGQTTFTFPTFTPGQTFATGTSFNYAYNPSWTGGSIGSNAGLSASASFNYDIAGFSGSHSLFDAGLNTSANGNIGGGSTLFGGTANGTAVGPSANFGLTASAYVASASAGVNVGVNLQTSLSYTPTVQYGYYTWVNTTGGYSPSDTLTWHGVSSGNLGFTLDSTLPSQAGSNTFFVNYAPGVQVDLAVDPTSYINLPVSGYFSAEAFGATIVNQTFPIGTVTAYTANYDQWDDDMNFNGKYYSLELTQSDQCPGQDISTPACAHDTVDGSGPVLGEKINFPGGGGSGNLTGGGGTGSWDNTFANSPLLPNFCDPSTNQCYASNDPNAPIGTVTVTTTNNPFATPEPSSFPLLGVGLLALALCLNRPRP
ncbi:MAG TPA: hypothetical protein VKF79_10385 [Candidatus Acidoferrum sp.]|nr:hypothetical protein [Candidatus Acidoferrum sp.]